MHSLVLIKIGGGLITDKSTPFSLKEEVMGEVAKNILAAAREYPQVHFLLGNGGGSFGHTVAKKYSGKEVTPKSMSEIHHSVVDLNARFVDVLIKESVPAFSVGPASFIVADNSVPRLLSNEAVRVLLERGVMPVVYGDMVSDTRTVGSIVSTEQILYLLADTLRPFFEQLTVLYLGDYEGVLKQDGTVLKEISLDFFSTHEHIVTPSLHDDVTGGMRHKVEEAFKMAKIAARVYIGSGFDESVIVDILSGKDRGTRIVV